MLMCINAKKRWVCLRSAFDAKDMMSRNACVSSWSSRSSVACSQWSSARSGSVTTWMGDTADSLFGWLSNWTLVVGWPAAFLACACSVNIVDSLQHVQLIGCGDQRAGVQTVRQNITKLQWPRRCAAIGARKRLCMALIQRYLSRWQLAFLFWNS